MRFAPMNRQIPSVALIALGFALTGTNSLAFGAEKATYGFKADQPVCYEVKISEEQPGTKRSTVSYLKYRPTVIDAQGQTTFRFDWNTANTTESRDGQPSPTPNRPAPAFLFGPQPADNFPGAEITIDALGNVVKLTGNSNLIPQMGAMLGPVHLAGIQPLPPKDKITWSVERPITVYTESKRQEPGGPWGKRDVTVRNEESAKEKITYTADAPANGRQTVREAYSLVTDKKTGDKPTQQMTGTGEYVFDTTTGTLLSYDKSLANEITLENASIRLPVTLSVRRLGPDDLAKLKVSHDEHLAHMDKVRQDREKRDAERKKAEATGASSIRELPANMTKTESVGGNGGGEFMKANLNGMHVIGFRIKMGSWAGKKCLRTVEPLYVAPETQPGKDETDVIARDGFAVAGIWVNGDDTNANAIRVIFQKKTDKGLEEKDAYVSPWVGEPHGPTRTRVGCTGDLVAGIFGRQGLNVARLGLVMRETDSTDDPHAQGKKPSRAVADPTDDPNFKGDK